MLCMKSEQIGMKVGMLTALIFPVLGVFVLIYIKKYFSYTKNVKNKKTPSRCLFAVFASFTSAAALSFSFFHRPCGQDAQNKDNGNNNYICHSIKLLFHNFITNFLLLQL